jgi:DNA helicase-2/ATP-dependent DNA helicase PcrA
MTVHSAKGLEWDAVVMVGMEEGQIPHYRSVKAAALAEEQRILYVGMTRARERLFLFSAACRHGREAGCSRFLEPLLGEAIETWRA